MDKLKKLADQMKKDWDRRIKHDYRFWMSDGYSDDATMWASGARDFELMCGDLQDTRSQTFLEIGCGVGRILRAAAARFGKVIGLDVSQEAIAKARALLSNIPSIDLIAGNGVDLQPLQNESVDLVFSFAAITSIPTEVIANYLREIKRVLRPAGLVRLQIYLGQEQPVRQDDTLHLRCFQRANFERAAEAAGLDVRKIEDFNLPFQVSFKELGFEAVKVTMAKTNRESKSTDEIAKLLLPQGEIVATDQSSHDLEYWMSVNYAKELADRGCVEEARQTLEYAVNFSKTANIDVQDLLEQIIGKIEGQRPPQPKETAIKEVIEDDDDAAGDPLHRNLRVLKGRFPEVFEALQNLPTAAANIELRETADGPVIYFAGQCLDHPAKPIAGAKVWVERSLQESRFKAADAVAVYGFGCGYHVEELLRQSRKPISVIEPDPLVLLHALQARDLSAALSKLDRLITGQQPNVSVIDEGAELLIRPQTQAVAAEALHQVKSHFYATRGLRQMHPKIAVLGPVQGGTLPIMEYTVRALALEQQRVREIDMRNFAGGYHAIEGVINNELIRNAAQGTYIETLSKFVYSSLVEKPVDILICMAQAPIVPDTLTELRKRGVTTVLWFVEDYLRFTSWQIYAPYFDFIFTIQKGDCIEAIKKAGCSEVHYLPTGCDPFVHVPLKLTPEETAHWGSPISFMGAGYHNRQQMFAALANMPFKIWGTEWPDCKPFDKMVQEKGRRLGPEEYVKIFNGTKINLNLHSSTERDGVDPRGDFVNPRTFELAGIGAFQLVDERSLLTDVFAPGKELITFKNVHDLKEKIAYYLEHEDERLQIAQRGRERALREHTYQHRIRKMLQIIYASRYEHIKRRVEADPWQKMLQKSKEFPELHTRCEAAYRRGEEPGLDGLVADIITGRGNLSETEQKLLFLFHVSKQMIRLKREELGDKGIAGLKK